MATTVATFIAKVLVQGQENLDELDKRTQQVERSMNGLQTAIAGLALGALIKDGMNVAKVMTDLANATNISLQAIVGFGNAVAKNGGSIEQANDAISDLVKNIGDAASGSGELQKAFATAGVSLRDLATLSEQELLEKTINGIARLGDSATQSSTKAKIFGEALKTVDLGTVNRELADSIQRAREQANSIQAAAEANRRLNESYNNLRQGAINALEPILKLLGEKNVTVEAATKLFQALGVIVGIVYGAKVIAALKSFIELVQLANSALKAQVAVQTVLASLSGPAGWKMLAVAAGVAAGSVVALNKLLEENAQKSKEAAAAASQFANAGAGRGFINPPTVGSDTPVRTVVDANAKAIAESRLKTEEALANSIKITRLSSANELQKIDIESAAEIAKVRREIAEREKELGISLASEQAARIREINAKADSDRAKYRRDLNARIYSEELAQVEQNAREMGAYYQQVDLARIQASTQIQGIQNARQELERRTNLQMTLVTLSDREAKNALELLQIEEQRLRQLQAIARIQNLPFDERLQRERDINNEFDRQRSKITERQEAELEASRSFENGWVKAYNDYLESSRNAFQTAGRLFQRVTSGMEDAIINFAKTGKFEFRSFMASILEEILRSQVRGLIAQLFGASGGRSGGLLGGNIIPGFLAKGGPAIAGRPYIVGEKGPELFVPNNSGTVVPNGEFGMAGAASITYNINAVDAMSFKQLVARDPGFIYAVTEQGRKVLPQTRR